jgi:hypothetical protein
LTRKIPYVKLLDGAVRIRQSTIDKILGEGAVEPFDPANRKRPQRIAVEVSSKRNTN